MMSKYRNLIWNEVSTFRLENIPQNELKISMQKKVIKEPENFEFISIGGDIFSFPYFYNNGNGQTPGKYLLFDSQHESIGTITLKTSYQLEDQIEQDSQLVGKGKLLIKILKADLTRDANNHQFMNPRCIFSILGLHDYY